MDATGVEILPGSRTIHRRDVSGISLWHETSSGLTLSMLGEARPFVLYLPHHSKLILDSIRVREIAIDTSTMQHDNVIANFTLFFLIPSEVGTYLANWNA